MNKGGKILSLVFSLIFLILVSNSFAARISGEIYDLSLEKVQKAVIEVNSIPAQRMVAQNGSYVFELPPGNYVITAKYKSDSDSDEFSTSENLTIVDRDGRYVLDLFLFYDFPDSNSTNDIDLGYDDLYGEENTRGTLLTLLLVIILLGVCIFLVLVFRAKKETKNIYDNTADETVSISTLDEQIKFDILRILKIKGGAATQKELRKNFDYSEAKISIIIKQLEKEGKVEKEKRGTVNYIKLK